MPDYLSIRLTQLTFWRTARRQACLLSFRHEQGERHHEKCTDGGCDHRPDGWLIAPVTQQSAKAQVYGGLKSTSAPAGSELLTLVGHGGHMGGGHMGGGHFGGGHMGGNHWAGGGGRHWGGGGHPHVAYGGGGSWQSPTPTWLPATTRCGPRPSTG